MMNMMDATNTEIAIIMFINLLVAIGMCLSVSAMNNKFARIMTFLWVMTPTFGIIILILTNDNYFN